MNESKESDEVALCAKREFNWRGKTLKDGERFCAGDVAFELICDGKAELANQLAAPPFQLLENLAARLQDLSLIGPRFDGERQVNKVFHECLPSGRRLPAIEDRKLNWIPNAKLNLAVQGTFDWEGISFARFFGMLGDQIAGVRSRSETKALAHKPDEDTCLQRGLVTIAPPKRTRLRGSVWDSRDLEHRQYFWFADVGEDWARFARAHARLNQRFRDAINNALLQGRILAASDSGGDAQLIPPWDWGNQHSGAGRRKSNWYLFSRDLPQDWSWLEEPLRLRKKRARQFLRSAEEQAEAWGKRLSEAEALELLMGGFGLSEHAARDVWRKGAPEKRRPSGARHRDAVLLTYEINQLRIMVSEF